MQQRFLSLPHEPSNIHSSTWEACLTHLDGSIDVESVLQTLILLKEDYEFPLWVTRENMEEHGRVHVPYLYLICVALICEQQQIYSLQQFGTSIAHASLDLMKKLVAESSMMLGVTKCLITNQGASMGILPIKIHHLCEKKKSFEGFTCGRPLNKGDEHEFEMKVGNPSSKIQPYKFLKK